jgi:uncharacterized membrane protein HdeD (DUF308 family)
MKLTPPKKWVFWVSVVLAVLGVLFLFVPSLSSFAFWAVLVAYVLLALGNAVKGF